jgi:hypothetical protein
LPGGWFGKSTAELRPFLRKKTAEISAAYLTGIEQLINAVIDSDRRAVKKLQARVERQIEKNAENRGAVTRNIKQRATHENVDAAKSLLYFFGEETELLQNMRVAVDIVRLHVLNLHRPLDPDQQSHLQDYFKNIQRYLELVADEQSSRQEIQQQMTEIERQVDAMLSLQIIGNVDNLYSHKNNELLISTIIRHTNASKNLMAMLDISERSKT